MDAEKVHIIMAARGTPDTAPLERPETEVQSPRDWLADVYHRTVKEIYVYCRRQLWLPDLAEDAVSATYLKLVECRDVLQDRGFHDVRNWLYGTARNAVRSIHGQRRNQRRLAEHLADYYRDCYRQRVVTQRPDRDSMDLHAALSTLKPVYREVILLRYYQKLSFAAVAEIVGINQNNARVLLSRALRSLRKKLSDLPGRQI